MRSRRRDAHGRELQPGPFRDFRVGLLHGRMKADEKDAVMRRFKAGEISRAGRDHRDRGRHRRAERDHHGDRARRAFRPGAAPPAARAGGARRQRVVLLPRRR